MELTKKDRLFLINQYEILKRLDSSQADHYDQLIEILSRGYAVLYGTLDEWISDDMPEDEGALVIDTLNLYRAIDKFNRKNPGDTDILNHMWGKFAGFDGNDETAHMGLTRFIVMRQGRFAEQKTEENFDSFNHHAPTVDKYRRMVRMWRENGRKCDLTKSEILEMLDA